MNKYEYVIENTTYGKTKEFGYIKKAVNYMEENYSFNITITDLCNYICLSEGYFMRIFKKQFNITPIQYLNNLRLFHANLLLKHGSNVTEAANSCGFDNISYFIRQYKKRYHVTPGEFRKESFLNKTN